ncbi:MAG: hypothetical protein C5S49_05850 [Candidatus Methanogaster sp.]|nr:MAG: hypothetical protein C5S49_05850 [ANME-2 cluster archaeon]
MVEHILLVEGESDQSFFNMTFEDVDLITNLNVTKYITY